MLSAWFIVGATATGKSAIAQRLAERLGCAVLSADAMLVYRRMDIGTAKPRPAERSTVPYFGVDLVTPDQPFSTGLWLADARRALQCAAGAVPPDQSPAPLPATQPSCQALDTDVPALSPRSPALIVAGGTGLYVKALTSGLDGTAADPAARAHWQTLYEQGGLGALQHALEARAPGACAALTDPANPRRLIRALEHIEACGHLPTHWKHAAPVAPVAALRLPREQLHARITRRIANMFEAGFIDEVSALRRDFPVWSDTARQAIGYAEVCALLDGALTQREAAERIAIRTRQLAKRQETWLRHQTQAVWIDIEDADPLECVAQRVLETWRQYGPTPLVFP